VESTKLCIFQLCPNPALERVREIGSPSKLFRKARVTLPEFH